MTPNLSFALAPATQGCFSETEEFINQNEPLKQKIISIMSHCEQYRGYRSILDFVFCELFPSWKIDCNKFYKDNGKSLADASDPEDWRIYDSMLLKVFKAIHENNKIANLSWQDCEKSARTAWIQDATLAEVLRTVLVSINKEKQNEADAAIEKAKKAKDDASREEKRLLEGNRNEGARGVLAILEGTAPPRQPQARRRRKTPALPRKGASPLAVERALKIKNAVEGEELEEF